MVFLVLGPESNLTQWCHQTVHAICQACLPASGALYVEDIRALTRALLTLSKPTVVTVFRPDPIMCDAVVASRCQFVLAAPVPRGSVAFKADRHGWSSLDATRRTLSEWSALAALSPTPCRFVVEPEAASQDGAALVGRIAEHLGLPCTPGQAAAISAEMRPLLAPPDPLADHPPAAWSAQERHVVDAAVDGLGQLLTVGKFDRVIATRDFFTAQDTGQPAVGEIDATGRERLLVFGPYWSLPPGNYTARCVYSFSAALVGTAMSVDVVHFAGGFHELARTDFTVTSPGRLDVNVRFSHVEPVGVLEVRLFSNRVVFDGTINVGYVEFSRSTDDMRIADAS